mmetsp:Transcript_154462/g.495223  ORF Transcript_154462/g.495223 Transcript_154462/m.495223 type:complete len:877 (+) Transcript_154462:64-2694(+)|eukprot:CAMPEP_0204218264 /NCGR_PEP_ID=MMETSP0361-20130328/79486_1 /ASSEMBLY_ACC=CAM_ASM_000343 /TAXON_ID=268821 /ORGANISM="Scrippsiella Hangoei, Strain SHTV-5" /LENGTH=876 /DNA_ID=CAMNT_0051183385 /DNA_START=22 /DNA_END=2652 /DNA_ORIENTATION=+
MGWRFNDVSADWRLNTIATPYAVYNAVMIGLPFLQAVTIANTGGWRISVLPVVMLCACIPVTFGMSLCSIRYIRHKPRVIEALEVTFICLRSTATSLVVVLWNVSCPSKGQTLLFAFILPLLDSVILVLPRKTFWFLWLWCMCVNFASIRVLAAECDFLNSPHILSTFVLGGLVVAAGNWVGNLTLKALYATELNLQREKRASESLVSMFCSASCVVSADGETVVSCDSRFDMLMGHSMTGKRISDHLPDSEDSLRYQQVFAQAHVGTEPAPVTVLPVTACTFSGTRVRVSLYIVGGGATSLTSKAGGDRTFLIGICQIEEEMHLEPDSGVDFKSGPTRISASSVTSDVQTTRTGQVFRLLSSPGDVEDMTTSLNELAELGRKEHWLIGEGELMLNSDQILGSGSFGVVMGGSLYGSQVAVKIPLESLLGLSKSIESSSHELRILRRCRHPNLVLFHGAVLDVQRFRIGLVLEMVDGCDLNRWVKVEDGQVSALQYRVILGLCRALWYLHSQSPAVVHGDVKSANVLIAGKGLAVCTKLVDFGLSRLLTRNARPLGGTRRWVAPEVLHNKGLNPDSSSDVFSLGRVVSFLVTGIQPLQGVDDVAQALQSAATARLGWPESPETSFAKVCKPLVEACLHFAAKRRPTSREIHDTILGWPALVADGSCGGVLTSLPMQTWSEAIAACAPEAQKQKPELSMSTLEGWSTDTDSSAAWWRDLALQQVNFDALSLKIMGSSGGFDCLHGGNPVGSNLAEMFEDTEGLRAFVQLGLGTAQEVGQPHVANYEAVVVQRARAGHQRWLVSLAFSFPPPPPAGRAAAQTGNGANAASARVLHSVPMQEEPLAGELPRSAPSEVALREMAEQKQCLADPNKKRASL